MKNKVEIFRESFFINQITANETGQTTHFSKKTFQYELKSNSNLQRGNEEKKHIVETFEKKGHILFIKIVSIIRFDFIHLCK